MDDKQALWDAIVENPDDDDLRLIYADWLEEHDDIDRSSFIRAQIERRRLPVDDVRQIDLALRARELLRRHRNRWIDEVPKWARKAPISFERGFATGVAVTGREFLSKAAQAERKSVLQGWQLGNLYQDVLQQLAQYTHLERVRSLTLYSQGSSMRPLNGLLAHLASAHLRHLSFSYPRADRSVGVSLSLPRYDSLTHLDVSAVSQDQTQDLMEQLLTNPSPGLQAVHLRTVGAGLGVETLRTWLALPAAVHLRELRFSTVLRGEQLAVLAEARKLTGLQVLHVTAAMSSSSESVAALLRCTHWPRLSELSINLSDDEMPALLEGPHIGNLRSLDLDSSVISSRGVRRMAESSRIGGLTTLSFRNARGLNDQAVELLARSPYLNQLRVLDLYGTQATEQALQTLAATPNLAALRVVVFGGTHQHHVQIPQWNERHGHRFEVVDHLDL